ncbi:MAG: hypothetical protein HXX08_21675 [Chloroflexi bacterium]|uniref:Uncharacterized protein n=1 Tax=Candidatus Chlorohelix allophototropha TaxID=3003348 RepID=A0A8T7M8L5_9CHLR|nr:hypothetical protein [Chloroflexota bacterium]WJW68408.1 hypothetical protein OZ401_004019 [Chloroflexota bacterium L227-S17]
MIKSYFRVAVFLLLAMLLVSCGDPTATLVPTVAATTKAVEKTAVTTTAIQPTQKPASNGRATPTVAERTNLAAEDTTDLAKPLPERSVVRTFTDAQGRTVRLTYGRGVGHSGDYGWAHIVGKHVQSIWYDGGTITTFPKALGTRSLADVLDLIGKSLQDKAPDDQGNGRRSYVYQVPGTNSDVFTVVGSDGTIITAYPVPRGSKDEG